MNRFVHIINRDSGFTLIEVFFFFFFLALALLAMAGMQAIALRGNSFANQISQGGSIAEDIVESLMVLDFNDPAFNDTTPVGLFTTYHETNPPAGYSVQWHVDSNSPTPQSKTINVDITWKTTIGTKDFSVSLVKVAP